MAISYGDIRTWTEKKDLSHVPTFDTVCQFLGIPAFLEIGACGLCEDCGYGHVDTGEYSSTAAQLKLLLMHCLDDSKVRCMRCAAKHFGDAESAEGEPDSETK